MTAGAGTRPEFPLVVELDDLPEEGAEFDLVADADERAALARRFALLSLDRFEAHVELHWVDPGEVLEMSGSLSADVVQTCVVTLDPVRSTVEAPVELTFARDPDSATDFVDPDDAEPLEGDTLDIGEIVSEELSLALDPYPRRLDIDESTLKLGPGATLSRDGEGAGNEKRNSPFEVLAKLKGKL